MNPSGSSRSPSRGRPAINASPDLGPAFHAYVAGGAADDHEGTRAEDAKARVRQGMRAMMRLGSAWYDVEAQIRAVTEDGLDPRSFILCTDDCFAKTLVQEGHMNRVVRHAIQCGCDPLVALQMATLNTAAHFRLERELGSITPGRRADAILTLTDSRGKDHHVVLQALHGNTAELSIAGVDVTHPFLNVTDMWFGDYILLWKPPNGAAFALGRGSRGDNVVWLRESLAAIDDRYRAEPLDSIIYDAELEQRVIDFQRDHRLDVDGLAGQQTQIIINSLLGSEDTPRLTTPRLARD